MSQNRVLTIPNGLSFLRLLGVPVFFWLIAVQHADTVALILLLVSAATDWLDGYLARILNQFSDLGALIDPIADRLYIAAALIALLVRDIVPIWLATVLILRDVYGSILVAYVRRKGYAKLPVHFPGKAATMNLLYALPLLLLGTFSSPVGRIAHVFGWAFVLWGVGMYWYGALLYTRMVRHVA